MRFGEQFGGAGAGAAGVNEHGQLRVSVNPNVNTGRNQRPRTSGPELTTFSEPNESRRTSKRRLRLELLTHHHQKSYCHLRPRLRPRVPRPRVVSKIVWLAAGAYVRQDSGDRTTTSKRTSILAPILG